MLDSVLYRITDKLECREGVKLFLNSRDHNRGIYLVFYH